MRRLLLALGCASGVFAARAPGTEPTDVLRAALQDFLDQPSYTWGATNVPVPIEETGAPAQNGEIGQHQKSGYTKVNFLSGPHIPQEELPLAKPWPGFTDRDELMTDRWVFWTPEGWKWLKELPELPATPAPLPIPPPPTTPSTKITIGGKSGGISVSRTTPLGGGVTMGARLKTGSLGRKLGIRRPDHVIAFVLRGMEEVTQVSPGVFEATLSSKAAAELLSIPTVFFFSRISVERASARVTVYLTKGQLVRYEISYAGVVNSGGTRRTLSRTYKCEIFNLGTTVIEVPPEVRSMMGE